MGVAYWGCGVHEASYELLAALDLYISMHSVAQQPGPARLHTLVFNFSPDHDFPGIHIRADKFNLSLKIRLELGADSHGNRHGSSLQFGWGNLLHGNLGFDPHFVQVHQFEDWFPGSNPLTAISHAFGDDSFERSENFIES